MNKKESCVILKALIAAFFLFFLCIVPVMGEPLADSTHVWLNMANNDGALFSDNGSYYLKFEGGGLNAVHITNDVDNPSGSPYTSANQSGTFYITDTGGRGYSDDIILMVAVNGTIRDDFKINIKGSGYRWDPVAIVNTLPLKEDLSYVPVTIDEEFVKSDFIYGPQTWKPAGTNDPLQYPIYCGQNVSDTEDTFSIVFIDLKAGTVSKATNLVSPSELTDSGAVKIEYEFTNMDTFAAFNAYAWCNQSNQGNGISWSNANKLPGASGLTVAGVPVVPSGPQTYNVKVDGSGDYTTIQSAVDASNAGDTIIVWDGTYNEYVNVDKTLDISSANGASVTSLWPLVNENGFHITADNVNLTGFTIQNCNGNGYFGIFLDSANNCTIKENLLHATDRCREGIKLSSSDSNIIYNNTFYANQASNKAVYLVDSSSNEFYENNIALGTSVIEGTSAGNIWHTPDEMAYTYNGSEQTSYLGNYWSAYIGSDSGSDGIGDTAFTISGDVTDEYPLIAAFENYQVSGVYTGAHTYNVRPDGSGDYTTIQSAVDGSSSGDTIIVWDGSYQENVDVDKTLDIRSANGASSTSLFPQIQDHGFYITADNVNITGFTIQNVNGNGNFGIFLDNVNNCIIRENLLHSTDRCREGIKLSSSDSNIIYNNTFYANQASNKAVYLVDSSSNEFYENNIALGTSVIEGTSAGNIWHTPDEMAYTYSGSEQTSYLGNYWSAYSGSDSGSDGIGDTAFTIPGDVTDDYPLIATFENYEVTGIAPPAQTYNVKPDGSGDYTTIQAAIDASNAGDTIVVWDGSYQENVNIDKTLDVRSGNGASVTTLFPQVQDYGFHITADNVNLTGFTLRNVNGFFGIFLDNADNGIISDNIFDASDRCREGIKISSSDGNKIFNNTINANQASKMALYVLNSSSNEFYQNNIVLGTTVIEGTSADNVWNSPDIMSYSYNGGTYSSYLGNYRGTYSGDDSDGNGIIDTPCVISGIINDTYPLKLTLDNYQIHGMAVPVASVTISPHSPSVTAGDSTTFTATAYDGDGNEISGAVFSWSSSDISVGSISALGEFSALVSGTTTVTAESGGESAGTIVTVQSAVEPEVLSDYNNIFLTVANDDGVKYDDYSNNTYNVRFEGVNRGMNSLHISTDYSDNFGQLTTTENQTGVFYATDTGGKGYEDNILLMVAVNGTIPSNFRMHVHSEGYTWAPNEAESNKPPAGEVTFQASATDEWFTADDFIYGPQIWKPNGNEEDYPILNGQDMTDSTNTFRIAFIDLNCGVLGGNAKNSNSALDIETLENRGAVKIEYTFENLQSYAAMNVYGYCKLSNNGEKMVAWTNRNTPYYGTEQLSGYSVTGIAAEEGVLSSIKISPSSSTVLKNADQQFEAEAYDGYGNILNTPLQWSVDDSSAGSVSASGLFTAGDVAEPENVVVSASNGSVTGITQVRVVPQTPELTNITISGVPDLAYAGYSYELTATGKDQWDSTIPGVIFTWSSDSQAVATVDADGSVSAVSKGNAHISAVNGSKSGSVLVTVDDLPDWSLLLSGKTTRTITRSEFIELSNENPASYTDNGGIKWDGVNLSTLAGLVDDDDEDTINEAAAENGYTITVYGKKNGNAGSSEYTGNAVILGSESFVIAYKLNDKEISPTESSWPLKFHGTGVDSGSLEAVSAVNLSQPDEDFRTITVVPDKKSLWSGKTTKFSAEVKDFYGGEIHNPSVEWSVSNSNVGTINNQGTFTAAASGRATITAKSGSASATATVNVNPSTQAGIVVDQNGDGDYTTIMEAIGNVTAGDTILVNDGEYTEYIVIDKAVTLKSINGPDYVTLKRAEGQTNGISLEADNVEISGFTLNNGTQINTGDEIAIIFGDVSDITIKNNVITSYPEGAICSIKYTYTQSNFTITGNRIINNNGNDQGTLGVIYLTYSTNSLISDNILERPMPRGIYVRYGNSNIVRNNLIANATDPDMSKRVKFSDSIYIRSDDCLIENNTISNCNRGLMVESDFCTILNNSVSSVSWAFKLGDHNIAYGNDIASTENVFSSLGDGNVIYKNNFSNSGFTFSIGSGNQFNSTEKLDYDYNDITYNSYLGNYWNNYYTGSDLNNDGIGDTSFIIKGAVSDNYPLMSDPSAYKSTTGEDGTKTCKTSLDIGSGKITCNGNGNKTISINTTDATVSGNNIEIKGNGFTVVVNTDSAPSDDGTTITGNVSSIVLETEPVTTTLPTVGDVSAGVELNLTSIPAGAKLDTTITEGASGQGTSFQIAATGSGLNVNSVAYTMNIVKTNLLNGQDISDAKITMQVAASWVLANGGTDSIKIIRIAEDGTKQVLNTVLKSNSGGIMIFEAISPDGLSLFGLTSVSPAPGVSSASVSGTIGSGGKSEVGIDVVENILKGETASFIFDETIIDEIDVKAALEIPSLMLSVEKDAKPENAPELPGSVYQYLMISDYHAPEGSVEMATIRFGIIPDWISGHNLNPEDVVVYLYDAESEDWKELSTVYEDLSGGLYRFFADTDKFGYFAVSYEKSEQDGINAGDSGFIDASAGVSGEDSLVISSAENADVKSPLFGGSAISIFIYVLVAAIAVCINRKKLPGK